jgi:hypothetical protein
MKSLVAIALLAVALAPAAAFGEASSDRFSAGGYFRIMAQPDFEGGNGQLGYSDLYGRLLNEGPYAALELKLDVLQAPPGTTDVWASVHAKIEGGSVQNADGNNGNLGQFRLSQLYVQAGNILFDHVTWQLGTLDFFAGDLGLYDLRLDYIFNDTVGLSARYDYGPFELLLGVGDAGYAIHGLQYNTVLSGGGWLRYRAIPGHLEIGVGGQGRYEPAVPGNQYAPYATPGIAYEDYVRQDVVAKFLEANPGQQDFFPNPVPRDATSYRVMGYLGFGHFGPIRWNNFFIRYDKLHPLGPYQETVSVPGIPQPQTYTIYVTDLTNRRYQLLAGDEIQFTVIPDRLDAVWAAQYGLNTNKANTVAVGQDNFEFESTVLRLQLYLTQTVHYLVETSLARETSLNGNMFRDHQDSIFQSTGGVADTRGLEFGDDAVRDTFQFKTGFVLNPKGPGVYMRPSLRVLYGLQYSTQQAAYGNGFVASLNQYNVFQGPERHWHSLVAIEAEEWF